MQVRLKRLLRRWTTFALVFVALFGLLCNRWVINSTGSYIYRDWSLLPQNEVGVVLGTSKYSASGDPSIDFEGRIRAAAQLYQLGKVKHLIVSGANPDSTYNEPRRMWQELVKAGVPPEAITMDFAGLRTFDSMSRAGQVFGLSRFTIVTQKYHCYRAVFIARKLGYKAVAYIAPGREYRHPPREVLARVKAVLDLFLLRTEPKFLGAPEPIQVDGEAPA